MSDSLPARMLRLMSDGRWYSQKELIDKLTHRYSATMHVLKKRGHVFEKRRITGQTFEYRLVVKTAV